MTTVVYNIPVSLVAAYRGRAIIVRSEDPAELVKAISEKDLENLVGVQLLSLTAEVNALADWGNAVTVELVMVHPEKEFPLLYRHAKLFDKHPVRVSIPVVAGFSKAVKVATSLQFIVKLELGQPDADVIDELCGVLDSYLHQPMICQPIEPFHSALMASYYGERAALWDIQEEDPAYIRYVTEDGRETIARRFGGGSVTGDIDSFVPDLKRELLARREECSRCEFFERCGGYFKWPRRDFACDGVKTVLRTLIGAADELKRDLAVLLELKEEAHDDRKPVLSDFTPDEQMQRSL